MKRIFIDSLHEHIDETVTVSGWVHARRDQGKMVFFELRDMSGIVQSIVLPDSNGIDLAKTMRNEWVIQVEGLIKKRPEKMINADLENGDIELEATTITVLSESETPPFDTTENTLGIEENTRLKYRYIDMRSDRMQRNMRTRAKLLRYCRDYLDDLRFTEVETPLLAAPTKEGSRDFVVPSRRNPGRFYALPQSPQQYKQLLMAGGMERYYQMARAMRDEDLRADRSYEHTQIDLEMSFVTQEDVMQTVEGMIIHAMSELGVTLKDTPFPRFTYAQAMEQYGADKFDLRTEEDKEAGVLAFAWVEKFPFFKKSNDEPDDPSTKGEWTFTHNPFSMPEPEFLDDLLQNKNIENIITQQYDLVCNGYEAGGGSIRAHRPEILTATYKAMGYSDEEITESIGHMIEAFKYGTPPHGGIALGVDRLVMLITGEENLREVQAFPMTRNGNTAVMDAPIELPMEQLQELGIVVKKQSN